MSSMALAQAAQRATKKEKVDERKNGRSLEDSGLMRLLN